MLPHPEQAKMLGLTVDVHQQFADLAQEGQVNRPPVDPCETAPLPADLTTELDESRFFH